MSKGNILDEYSNNRSGGRSSCGGDMTGKVKELPCKEPVGPKGIMGNNRPGLGGTNHGNSVRQGKH